MDVYDEVMAAEARIRPHVRQTPLEYAHALSEAVEGRVYLKLENLQATGSFKLRGALSKLLALSPSERQRGIVAASTGNHGLAVAHALQTLGLRGTIYLPETASPQKVALLRRYDVDLVFHGEDGVEAERAARRVCEAEGRVYVSPYNDPHVVGGQGTVGVEILRQTEALDVVMASVGGGGLIGGVGGYLKAARKGIEVIGCLPENSPVMLDSIRQGRIVERAVAPTLSDGTAGGIETGALTFPLCQHYVDDWVLVDEAEIRQGLLHVFDEHRLVVEGAAGVVVAACLKRRARLAGQTTVLVLCGANIDVEKFKSLIC